MSTLDQSVFASRREQLAKAMGANAIAIIATRDEMYRNRDADYKYRPDSSFYYLTGFAEPEAVAVLETDDQGGLCYTLFCRERNRAMEIWNGYRAGIEGALAQYGADQAFVIEDLDDEIISAAIGTAFTGETGSTSTANANQIVHGSAGLTIAKLRTAKETLDLGSVDPSIPRHIIVSPKQITDLLGTTEVTSSDFNTVKALANGEINSFLGFNFIVSNRLSLSGSTRSCIAFAQDGIALAVGKDVQARIDERADKSYATQVYYCMSIGATRMEEEKVVEIKCHEA